MRKVISKHNDLLNYFLYDDKYLSKKYLSKCKKFFKELSKKKNNRGKKKMKIYYKENDQNNKYEEPVWLSIATGFACFGAIVATVYLLIAIEWLIKL